MPSEYFAYRETKRTHAAYGMALRAMSFEKTQLLLSLSPMFAGAGAVESIDLFVEVSAAGVSMAALERDQTRFETIL